MNHPQKRSLSRFGLGGLLLLVVNTGSAQPAAGDAHTVDCQCDKYVSRSLEAEKEGKYVEALAQMDSAMAHARAAKDNDQIGRVLVRRSEILTKVGDYNGALSAQLEALALRERLQDMEGLAEVNNHIGSIHQYQKNYEKAEEYYGRSLAIYSELGFEREMGKAYNNFGALYEDTKQPERAIQLHRRSLKIWDHLADSGWMAVSFMHIGICFDQLGQPDSARTYLFKSAEILKGKDNPYLLSMLYHGLGTNYLSSGNTSQALQWCKRSLAIAQKMKIALLQKNGCDCLSQVYDKLGDKGQALAYYKQFITLRDSLFGLANAQGITRIEMSHSFAKQQLADSLERSRENLRTELAYQKELARGREQRNVVMFGSLGILALAIGLWSRLRYVRRSRAVIERERERSEELLLNILPQHIAQELKDTGQAKAREIENVSILFTDFVGFTQLSQTMGPQELVAEIHHCFKAFDAIVTKFGIEKVKTIGDSYMAAGGLSGTMASSAANTVMAALEMQRFMRHYQLERQAKGQPAFTMRAGIHSGQVVAGIVGDKKFAYDIWGDTVNTASRMESSSEPGQLNISLSTHDLIKDDTRFAFIRRGKMEAKGKGVMEMFFAMSIHDQVPSSPKFESA
jgi:class 3 adenylate cyclase/Tfp pilus assembly protein PilF